MPCGFLSGFNRRFPRACAGAPGLRSRSYFGGVGSAGRPITFSEPVKSMDVAEGHSEQFNSCYFTPDASRLTNPCGLATGNGVSHAGVGRVRMRAFPCRASGPVLNTLAFVYGSRFPTCGSPGKLFQLFNSDHAPLAHPCIMNMANGEWRKPERKDWRVLIASLLTFNF
jgi:hypothetical protein